MYPRKFRSLIYNSFAKSVITYGLLAYRATSKTYLEPIEKAQRSIIRSIFLEKPFEKIQLFVEKLWMLTVYELYMKIVM